MNCDKEYAYEVRDIVIVKVDTDTGEEVLNSDGSIKHFRPKDMNHLLEYYDEEVEEMKLGYSFTQNTCVMTYKEKYEELCDLIKGDSPNWTHEEIKARLEEQVDALIEKEDG